MKISVWLAAISLALTACAPPGYSYGVGEFTPHPIDQSYPVTAPTPEYLAARAADRADMQRKIDSGCDVREWERLGREIDELRAREDSLYEAAHRYPWAYARLSALYAQDRALQSRQIDACPSHPR